MTFEMVKDPKLVRRRYNAERLDECRDMFGQLDKDRQLTAKIDTSLSNVRKYAKMLGYIVKTSKIDNTSCYVWIVESNNGKMV